MKFDGTCIGNLVGIACPNAVGIYCCSNSILAQYGTLPDFGRLGDCFWGREVIDCCSI